MKKITAQDLAAKIAENVLSLHRKETCYNTFQGKRREYAALIEGRSDDFCRRLNAEVLCRLDKHKKCIPAAQLRYPADKRPLETILREAMIALELAEVSWSMRPSFPNSYKWKPTRGKPYTLHTLVRAGVSGRILHKTSQQSSTDMRSFGRDTCKVFGIPYLKDAKDKVTATAIRRIKTAIARKGFSCA